MLVVKVGGRALRNLREICRDLAKYEFILVHGGGDEVSDVSRRMGIEPKFVTSPSGLRSRYTDENEIEVYVMVMAGKINKLIVNELLNLGIRAVGISGLDGPTLIAERKERIIVQEGGRRFAIPGGYTGRIVEVRRDLIDSLTRSGYSVVISPISRGKGGEILNVDGDQAAVSIAEAMLPEGLVILSDVDGVIVGGEVRRVLWADEIGSIEGIGGGMLRKLMMSAKVAGLTRVLIANGLRDEPVTRALRGEGTSIEVR
jgi:acetylglutamate/LysW-gamma-L-alpha-aminoadipate kinase